MNENINVERITMWDCLELYALLGKTVVINNGQITEIIKENN